MTTLNRKSSDYSPNLCDALSCAGCLACYNICKHNAIAINYDDEGFVYPSIRLELCVGCKSCEKVCPINGNLHKNAVSDKAYAAWAKDKKILRNSSSGGLYSVIANYVLRNGGVVFGAAFDKDWNVCHIAASCEEDFAKTRGSKYVQSYIGTTFQEVKSFLYHGKMVLFSGTPCQIAGLKSYLDFDHCETGNLYTIDLVCHGVPSPLVFRSYLNFLEKKFQSSVVEFTCRDKKWSWWRFNYRAKFANGCKYYGKWEEDYFSRGFLREFFLRSSCHQCAFATEQRCGDFTLCDYWGYYRKEGELDNKDMGVSLVIPNGEKAKELYKMIIPSVVSYERDIEEAMKSNQAFHRCFAVSPIRNEFWKDFREKGFEGVAEKYLYPEEIQPQFRLVYKYGRTVKRTVEAMCRLTQKTRRLFRKIEYVVLTKKV